MTGTRTHDPRITSLELAQTIRMAQEAACRDESLHALFNGLSPTIVRFAIQLEPEIASQVHIRTSTHTEVCEQLRSDVEVQP